MIDRVKVTRQIVAARVRGQHELAEQLEAQLVEANLTPPATDATRDLRAIPDHHRNSLQKFMYPPPYDDPRSSQ